MISWLIATALAAPLDADALRHKAWARDVDALLEAQVDAEDVGALVDALGAVADPSVLPRLDALASLPDAELRARVAWAAGRVPGAADLLRRRLAEEQVASVRAAILRGLGAVGDESDVAGLLIFAAREPAAALALGGLASRGIEVPAPPLLAALGGLDQAPGRARALAFALSRLDPTPLDPPEASRVARAWSRAPDDASRAWLTPWRFAQASGAARRSLLREALAAGPLTRAAAVRQATSQDLSESGWRTLADSGDPWVAPVAWRMLGVGPSGAVVVPDAEGLLEQALGDDMPAARSRAAARRLRMEPDARASLAAASDPVVRELVAAAVAAAPDAAGCGLVGAGLAEARDGAAASLASALAWVEAARACGARFPLRGAARQTLLDTAGSSDAVLRRAARTAVAAHGLDAPEVGPPRLSPPLARMVEDLDAVRSLRRAVVKTTQGVVHLTLLPDAAPLAVAAFAALAESGFYDGLAFHRVLPGVLIQTGDPRGDGMGDAGVMLPDEPNRGVFSTGSVGMATNGPDTGAGQWFILTGPQPHLDGRYTRFAEVSRGQQVARRLGPRDTVLKVIVERDVPVDVATVGRP